MDFIGGKGLQALLVATVAAAVAMPTAAAGADGPAATGSAKKGTLVKTLKKQTAKMAKLITALEGRVAALEKEKKAAPVLGGPAGGDLTGTYPNPLLGPNSVGSAELSPGSVGSTQLANAGVLSVDIADGTVGPFDLAEGAIGSAQLANGEVRGIDIGEGTVESGDIGDRTIDTPDLKVGSVSASVLANASFKQGFTIVPVDPGQTKQAFVFCDPGWRVLSGGFEWSNRNGNGTAVISSGPNDAFPNTGWGVQARVDSGGQANELVVSALCLAP